MNFNFFNQKTVKSNKKASQFSLKQYADVTLGNADFKEIVKLPLGEDLNEWLAVHIIDFYQQTNMLYGTITQYCTPQTCSVMSAGSKYEYLWADGVVQKKPIKVCAPEYVDLLMTWIQSLIDNEAIFPTRSSIFPKGFVSTVKNIAKRIFRVYAHIYHSHFEKITALQEEAHLNTCFRNFICFCLEFGLIDKREMAPMEQVVKTF